MNGVDLRNEYEAMEGKRALWQAGRPMGWANRPTFMAVWPKLRRGVFWNLLELSFVVFVG